MRSIFLEIPAEIAVQIKLPPKKAKKMLMEELVLRLYEEGIISAGQGAFLLKINRLSFERFLAEHHIPIHCEVDELDEDITNLESIV